MILMRHGATEGGAADPPEFKLGDCTTQRNLSEAGREQARRVGARLKHEHVPIAQVFTSPWCRCRDTAMLAFGKAEEWDALASTFARPDIEAELLDRARKRIGNYSTRKSRAGNVVMVTHNVNIAGLTKLSVAPAEMVVVRPDGCCGLRVVARIAPE